MLFFIIACLFLVVFARKIMAAGYQLGNNHAVDRSRTAFERVQTKEEFDQMILAYRDYYMREDINRNRRN